MPEKFMPKQKALEMHLNVHPPVESFTIFSGFTAGLRDAREATGRAPDTAHKIDRSKVGNWLGAVGYMALLDQIGTCFRPAGKAITGTNSIARALAAFTSLSSAEIDALYALRCAFAHDYSLYNINPGRPNLQHCFEVTKGTGIVVTLPATPWSGDYTRKGIDRRTTVDLEAFGDLVEQVCQDIFTLARAGQLDINLPGGSDELLSRYSYMARPRSL